MLNWDGIPVQNVPFSVARAIRAAFEPRHGGELVEEMVTIAHEVFRWADGYVLEMTKHGCHVHRLGGNVYEFVDIEFVARAGGAWPDEYEIAERTRLDKERADAEAILDAEFDAIFAVMPLSTLLPPANMNAEATK